MAVEGIPISWLSWCVVLCACSRSSLRAPAMCSPSRAPVSTDRLSGSGTDILHGILCGRRGCTWDIQSRTLAIDNALPDILVWAWQQWPVDRIAGLLDLGRTALEIGSPPANPAIESLDKSLQIIILLELFAAPPMPWRINDSAAPTDATGRSEIDLVESAIEQGAQRQIAFFARHPSKSRFALTHSLPVAAGRDRYCTLHCRLLAIYRSIADGVRDDPLAGKRHEAFYIGRDVARHSMSRAAPSSGRLRGAASVRQG